MFCKNCGKEIESDTKFCSGCGAAVNQIEEAGKNKSSVEDLIEELGLCLKYFTQIKDLYSFLSLGKNLVNNIEWRKKVNSNFVVGIIFAVIGFVGFIPTMKAVIDSEWVLMIFLWEVLLIEIVFVLVGGICALIFGKRKPTIKFYERKIPVIEQKVLEHYEKFENCPLVVEYTAPETISTMISYLKSGRANSLKEVMNLYEDECHKNQMITEMREMKAAAKKAATAATITAINTL